jgi:peroxiredoxin
MKILTGICLILMLSFAAFGQKSKVKPLAETFSVTSMEGVTFDLTELKGKVVLLTFWSTKCPICAAEIPQLNQLARSYQDREVVFLGLTMENVNKVEAHLKKKPFAFNVIPNSFDVVLKYADKDGDGKISMGFPAHFLINQKGEIELKTNGFDKTELLDERIKQLLSRK